MWWDKHNNDIWNRETCVLKQFQHLIYWFYFTIVHNLATGQWRGGNHRWSFLKRNWPNNMANMVSKKTYNLKIVRFDLHLFWILQRIAFKFKDVKLPNWQNKLFKGKIFIIISPSVGSCLSYLVVVLVVFKLFDWILITTISTWLTKLMTQ